MTRDEVNNLNRGAVLEHVTGKNADGTPLRCRVNGKLKTWKTRNDFQLPVKHGLKTCFYITPDNIDEWNKR